MNNKYFSAFMKQIFFALFCLFLLPDSACGQTVETISENDFINAIIEDFLSDNDELNVDPVMLYDQLNELKNHPININKAGFEELQQLFFIPDNILQDILTYRSEEGDFISVYELQAVPTLGVDDIRKMIPFITIGEKASRFNVPIPEMLLKGQNTVFVKWETLAEEQVGYSEERKISGSSYYLGDRYKLFLRYRHQYSNKLSYGFTAEKDPGEEFFQGSNKKTGFDFYSFHAFLKNYSPRLKAIALGDYAISLGQGLITNYGFGYGKSSFATLIKKGGPVLLPYTSTLENNFFRGIAATVQLSQRFECTAFASHRNVDANLGEPDSLIDYDFGFTSLQASGFHRTQAEIDDKNAIKSTDAGLNLKYNYHNLSISLNGLYTEFNKVYIPQKRLDNLFAFSGKSLSNISFDYAYIYRNFYFFGETARSDNGALATVNGVLITLDRRVDLALFHRYLPVDYQSLNPRVFAEGSTGSNENGFYLGAKFYPARGWTIDAYFDVWKNPWLRFNVASPSVGREYLAKIQYSIKRKFDIYIQYKNETKAQNISDSELLKKVGEQNKQQIRVHLAHKLNKNLELRNRFEWVFYQDASGQKSNGFMVFQDVLYKPIQIPVSFTARLAYFDTKDYSSRIYAFENDLLFSFSIPPYYYKGTRWYLNVRSKIARNIMLEAGIAQTILANQKTIGSGLEQINGNTKTELRAQMKLSF